MNETGLRWAAEQYESRFGGAAFYDLARRIAGIYPVQAAVIIMATWNTSARRKRGVAREASPSKSILTKLDY